MKIICTQENLSGGLQLVSHIASKNISLPILNNVLLKAEKGVLKLLATNLETGITCKVRGKVEKEGSYVNLLPKENIAIEQIDQNLKIESTNSKTLIKGIEASEFPLIPHVEPVNTYKIKTKLLKEALNAVAFAVSFDETRPEINGVYFSFKDNTLTMAATDSYRLAEKKIKLEQQVEDYEIIIPIKTIQELIRIIGEDDQEIIINSSDNQILFSIGETRIY